MIPSPEIKTFSVNDYFNLVWKRKWIVASILSVFFVLGVLNYLTAEKKFIATAEVSVNVDSKGAGIFRKAFTNFLTEQTLQDMVRSRKLASTVKKELDLEMPVSKLLDKNVVAIKFPRKGRIDILVGTKDPVLSAAIANSWATVFIKMAREKASNAFEQTKNNLEYQLVEVSKSLLNLERDLNEFERENQIVSNKKDRIKVLKGQIRRIEDSYQSLSHKYRKQHPKMLYLVQQMEELSAEMKREKSDLLSFKKTAAEYSLLEQRVRTERKIYNNLLNQVHQMDIASKLMSTEINIVNRAVVPTKPFPKDHQFPQFTLLGLMLGIGVCFLLEYFDKTIKSGEEVEFYARMPFLGYIPRVERKNIPDQDMNMLSEKMSTSLTSESFRNIKISFAFALPNNSDVKTVLVTSANRGEGKSFLSSNLAISFAHSGNKVLLVDADLRDPGLSKSIGEKNDGNAGLFGALLGKVRGEESIIPTDTQNMDFLPAGSAEGNNPGDLLSYETFNEMMRQFKQNYDYIVIDSPDALRTSDTMLISKVSDAMVFVIGASSTDLKDIRSSVDKLDVKGKFIGGVLNKFSIAKDKNYFYHYFAEFYHNVVQQKLRLRFGK